MLRFPAVLLVIGLLGVACAQSAPTASPAVTNVDIPKLGFDPATVNPKHEGKIGVPGLPAGFTYKDLVTPGKYDDPDIIAFDPSQRYLFFDTHLEAPGGSVYRVDLTTLDVMRLTTGVHRPGGTAYYKPGNVVIVAEEGTGVGPEQNQRGFHRAVLPDVPDQPTPPSLRAMGQYRGEGMAFAGADTIYLSEDHPDGGHIYKYVLDAPPDLSKGILYVLKQDAGWIKTAFLEAPETGKEGTKFFQAEGMEFGPDGKLYLCISALAETRVVAIDTTTGKVTDFVTAAQAKGFRSPDHLTFAPNGTLFITSKTGDVWAALPDGPDADALSDGVYRFVTGLGYPQGLGFSPDGSTFYVTGGAQADVVLAISGFKWQ